jgi:hypothetical protein
MTASAAVVTPQNWQKLGAWGTRVVLGTWAAFWLWFNFASAVGEKDGRLQHWIFAAVTAGLAATAWFWPRIGGVLMIAGAVLAASAFPNMAALTMLAAPAAAIGVLLLLLGRP